MAFSRGTNITKNGLVFGYDTGFPIVSTNIDSYRFNPGEPTTNILNGDIIGIGNGATLGSDSFGDYIQLANQTTSYSRFQLPNITVTSNDTYTWSFELYSTETIERNPGNIYYFDANEYSNEFSASNDLSRLSSSNETPSILEAGVWTPFRLTVTMKDGLTGAYTYDFFNMTYPTFQNRKIYYRNMQFEFNSHETPYAGQGGSRTTSNSLLDLKKTYTIPLTNITWDDNAQMIFDGVDDFIEVSNVGISDYANPFSFECVFKAEGTWANTYISNIVGINGSYGGFYGLGKSGTPGSENVVFTIRDTTNPNLLYAPIDDPNKYYHLVGVWDPSNSQIRFYVDGILRNTVNSATKTGAPDSTNLYIGGARAHSGDVGSWYDGTIPIVKYYNIPLTDTQVLQNYTAYKYRYL